MKRETMKSNKESTRSASFEHESYIAKKFDMQQCSNSGAGKFQKGDLISKDASISIECKTCIKEKKSFSIKKDWITKNKNEAFSMRISNQAICFNFGPNSPNYFVINEQLMQILVEKLKENNKSI